MSHRQGRTPTTNGHRQPLHGPSLPPHSATQAGAHSLREHWTIISPMFASSLTIPEHWERVSAGDGPCQLTQAPRSGKICTHGALACIDGMACSSCGASHACIGTETVFCRAQCNLPGSWVAVGIPWRPGWRGKSSAPPSPRIDIVMYCTEYVFRTEGSRARY